ncbi:capsule biosynthesis protein [Tropicibacter sp. R16_0]|uniref:capsule biosynthesis protein n=1 Tax=Tropicibacter sp. R16_0 TaxID=2821102 RepID=UPI001ADCBEFE|nr:capsule biosynthesis protein [Tropicibacter sp. R16_0]MBO9449111.1 capsule biosynthesis protein [Tropicibacter sp. R16_0]
MTTKPKAKKFRIRRNPATPAEAGAAPMEKATPAEDTAQSAAPAPATDPSARARAEQAAMQGQVSSARETSAETEIDAIKKEGLTGRQLRMARRVAQKHNLPATSDYDAVRLLRQNGIDPLKRSNMLELVVPKNEAETKPAAKKDEKSDKVQLPQTVAPQKQTLPSTELSPAERRDREISQIQRDIAKRRRKKLLLLMTRLSAFVFLPTLIVGWYFYVIATPMYSSKSEFLILQADNASGIGGLLSGTQFATSQDSIAVQSYLESKDGMLRLDRDVGFKSEFSQPWIDPIQRLPVDASNEEAYKTYSRNVKIGYDPTEGVIRMEVIAPDPAVATEFSEKLISYAEERVNNLSVEKRADQMKDAEEGLEIAEEKRREAQEALIELQIKGALLDPEGVIASLRSRINTVEIQLQEKELQLAALLDNSRPNRAKVEGARGDVQRLSDLLAQLNAEMTDASNGENSLARLAVRIQMAQADLATRDAMLQASLQQMETTRMEANRQVRYLTTSVYPVESEEPAYPRAFENTILAFLVFSGIYLMISLTASILREQVSS